MNIEKTIDGVTHTVVAGTAIELLRHLEAMPSESNMEKALELLFEATAEREVDFGEAQTQGLRVYKRAFSDMGHTTSSLRNQLPHPWSLGDMQEALEDKGYTVGTRRLYVFDKGTETRMVAEVRDRGNVVVGASEVHIYKSEALTMQDAIEQQKLLVLSLIELGKLPGVQL